MNILIPDNWLKEYLTTDATPQQFAEAMSLTSVSIERINKVEDDFVYDIEVTTNRPDLMSVEGIAREASAVLPQAGYKAEFHEYKPKIKLSTASNTPLVTIQNDPELVNRITCIVLEVTIKPSTSIISERLEKTGIRSLNNVIDATNYIMRELGHPVHAFDYDRLTNRKLLIRKSRKGERITTLDGKEYELPGNDIVADDGTGKIVDLLGIMGLENSSITGETKRVLLFIDNNNPLLLRKTSMNLGIRTEAAVLNEKGVDPEKMIPTLLRGVELLEEIADAKAISDIIDIYPNKVTQKKVVVDFKKINAVIGVEISPKTVISILSNLGFTTEIKESTLTVTVPSSRLTDIAIPEDIIEEVARVYGYHKIPNILPQIPFQEYYHQDTSEYYWVKKIKDAFKYWGFNETYTYSMVNEVMYDGPVENAIKLRNPLDTDHMYLRSSLTPSLFEVANKNKANEDLAIFELSNVYLKKNTGLPDEVLHLAMLCRGKDATFFSAKGIAEQIFYLLGIANYDFEKKEDAIDGAIVKVEGEQAGVIETDGGEVTMELNFQLLLTHAKAQKKYQVPSKYPPVIEDIRLTIKGDFTYEQLKNEITKTNEMIDNVSLLDVYRDKVTLRISYLNRTRNLSNEEVTPIREAVIKNLERKFKAKIG